MQTSRFRCHLSNSAGKVATIQNDHYRGFASFEDRSKTYGTFLHRLIPRIASINPPCEFLSGVSYPRWIANALFFFGVFGILAVLMFIMFAAIGWLVIVKLAIVAWFFPTAIRWFMRNKPARFDPCRIPENLLPRPKQE